MAGHRATLKKANKGFKSGHASKRALKAASKGKVEKIKSNNKPVRVQSKLERKNLANQLKHNKITKSLEERSVFDHGNVERIVTVIPLTSNVSGTDIANMLLGSVNEPGLQIKESFGVTKLKVQRFKTSLNIIIPQMNSLIDVLDSVKVADFVIFGLSATEEVDPKIGEQIIRAAESQGISTVFGVVPDLVSAYPKRNLQLDVLKSLTSFFKHFFPQTDKLFALETPMESLNLLRSICQKKPKQITWRDSRGYMVADTVAWEPEGLMEGHLVVEGTARGIGFHPDRLVHIPDLGDFAVSRIERISKEPEVFGAGSERESLDPLQEGEALEEVDMISDEDDWEIDEDEEDGETEKRLPKGISEYQARWMHDEELEELIEERGLESNEEADSEMESDDMDNDDASHMDLEPEEESRQLEAFKQREREELEFPDEIELHPDEPATKRLARYRGFKSLASADWDYDEVDDKTPENWNRYLRVRNYKLTKNKVLKQAKSEAVIKPGDKCRLYIVVPSQVVESVSDPSQKPLAVYSLLPNEHKLSVCHFSVQTWEDYEEPIKSKDSMVVQYGFRRLPINPVFSQATNNSNNVAKFQRFLHQKNLSIATAVVPVSFTNSPAIFFKNSPSGAEPIAQGTFLNTDYTRILAKRVVLTGEILKIHKSVVTVRYMFFNSKDVLHYQHIPLFTKMGRSGLIKESLGTHGYFKAMFDGKLNAQDVVGMALYKRVWPKEAIM
ncbi:hypothetical protein OGAPHI_000830 [Ogataea philodendri]|uniref:Bms1-type G domain-containing protein n=1 Tax=Ogataea philodendri TaxID=1378263 RepID=A0A9P8TA12_9ASCO|nr:uncharacterized protein OGAPHI_000830 [Ogataea philodendri]KAH3671119.1 hypothetical protein OGAPHI_000830 [Ogataea philodendri]